MSETTNLKLFKQDNPTTNTNNFDIEKTLNDNWDKLDENAGTTNKKLSSISPIELWEGTNIFELITNLETNFEVEYVVDKDSMLDEVQTAMLNAEIEI